MTAKIRTTYLAKVVVETPFVKSAYEYVTDSEGEDFKVETVYDAVRWERENKASDADDSWDHFMNVLGNPDNEELTVCVEVIDDENVMDEILDKAAQAVKAGLEADKNLNAHGEFDTSEDNRVVKVNTETGESSYV